MDDLLAMVKQEFSAIYDPKRTVYNDFDDVFRQLRKEVEARTEEMKKSKLVSQPTNNNISKEGEVQKFGFQEGNKKKNTGGSDGGDSENLKGCQKKNGHSNGNHVAADELPTAKGGKKADTLVNKISKDDQWDCTAACYFYKNKK